MTLNVAQFFAQTIDKEMKISHFDCQLFCGKKSKLKSSMKQTITSEMGDKYLEDADMLVIVQGEIISTTDYKKQLFGVLDRALGKVANNLNQSDIKEIKKDDTVDFAFIKITYK